MKKLDKSERFDETVKVLITVAAILVSLNVAIVRNFLGPTFVSIEGFFLVVVLLLWSFSTLFSESNILVGRVPVLMLLVFIIGITFDTFMTWRGPTLLEFETIIAVSYLAGVGAIIYLKQHVKSKDLKLWLIVSAVSAIVLMWLVGYGWLG